MGETTSESGAGAIKQAHAAGDWEALKSLAAAERVKNPNSPEGYYYGMLEVRHALDTVATVQDCVDEFAGFALKHVGLDETQAWEMAEFAIRLRAWEMAARLCAVVRAHWPDHEAVYLSEAQCLFHLGEFEAAYHVLSLKLRRPEAATTEREKAWLNTAFRRTGEKRFERMQTGGTDYSNGPKVVLVMYARGMPFEETARKLENSFRQLCKFPCDVKVFNLDQISTCPWFKHLEHCRDSMPMLGYRDGFYNAWKAYIVQEVMDELDDGDMVYYADASRHFLLGFSEDINTLIALQAQREETLYAGSFNARVLHSSGWMGDRIGLYEALGIADEYDRYMTLPAIQNSSFLLRKSAVTTAFVEEWVRHSVYETISLHHTVDQAIFSALVYKHGFRAFDLETLSVAQLLEMSPFVWGKDPNMVHRMCNSALPWYETFKDPRQAIGVSHDFVLSF